jgi:hypothetical protein
MAKLVIALMLVVLGIVAAIAYPLVGAVAALVGFAATWLDWRESKRVRKEIAEARSFAFFM